MANEDKVGTAYFYANVGGFSSEAWLGRIVGYAGTLQLGIAYFYTNVGSDIYAPGAVLTTESGDPITTETGDPIVTEDFT